MNLPESNILDTRHLQRLFDNMSESYKIFWFRAIVDRVAAGEKYITFDDMCVLTDRMKNG